MSQVLIQHSPQQYFYLQLFPEFTHVIVSEWEIQSIGQPIGGFDHVNTTIAGVTLLWSVWIWIIEFPMWCIVGFTRMFIFIFIFQVSSDCLTGNTKQSYWSVNGPKCGGIDQRGICPFCDNRRQKCGGIDQRAIPPPFCTFFDNAKLSNEMDKTVPTSLLST